MSDEIIVLDDNEWKEILLAPLLFSGRDSLNKQEVGSSSRTRIRSQSLPREGLGAARLDSSWC